MPAFAEFGITKSIPVSITDFRARTWVARVPQVRRGGAGCCGQARAVRR
jgi:hypothetical protein